MLGVIILVVYTMLMLGITLLLTRKETTAEGFLVANRNTGAVISAMSISAMKAIVKRLIDEGKTIDEIGKQLGMKAEEIFRLSDFTREDFLEMMAKGHEYSKAEFITQL